MTFFYIAIGGAIGALSRYGVSLLFRTLGGGAWIWPWATLSVNVIGGFIMGIVMAWLWQKGGVHHINHNLYFFITTGLLGGFTTFSTFSLELYLMLQKGEFFNALLYAALSLFLSLGAVVLGVFIAGGSVQ